MGFKSIHHGVVFSDITNIFNDQYIRYIKHQATFDLDATGVVASAATVAVIADK